MEYASMRDTILVVEDDLATRLAYEQLLERQGFQVLLARTGAEALDVFRARAAAISLIMTDFELQDIDGAELAQRLRIIRTDIPIVYATGLSEDHPTLRQALTHPRTELMPKPIDIAAVVFRLRRMFPGGCARF